MKTHGRPATYTSGCRCDLCRQAWTDYRRARGDNNAWHRALHKLRAQHPEEFRKFYEIEFKQEQSKGAA